MKIYGNSEKIQNKEKTEIIFMILQSHSIKFWLLFYSTPRILKFSYTYFLEVFPQFYKENNSKFVHLRNEFLMCKIYKLDEEKKSFCFFFIIIFQELYKSLIYTWVVTTFFFVRSIIEVVWKKVLWSFRNERRKKNTFRNIKKVYIFCWKNINTYRKSKLFFFFYQFDQF